MFRNYLKTARRNLKRHKSNSVINIAGLAAGFAAFLLIFLVIQYQESFDNFHTDKEQIYRLVRIGRSGNEKEREYSSGVPFPIAQGLRMDIPQLRNVATIYGDNNIQVLVTAADGSVSKKFKEKNILVAEPQFFQLFNFPLIAGDLKTALNDKGTGVLTKDVAIKYFGDWRLAIGKTIKLYGHLTKITGVLDNPPSNTDFPLGVVVSYKSLGNVSDDWSSISETYCFVQLNKNTSLVQLRQQLEQFTDKYIKPVNPGYSLSLQPLNEMHFDERYGNFMHRTFSRELILALSIIGVFLLIIACVNFINITTAQAVNRAREVGVRKVLGSNRRQLVLQFLGETAITTLLALIGSLLIVAVCLPAVNKLLDIQLTFSAVLGSRFLLFTAAIFVFVTFLSGFYPALVLSGFKSAHVLKSAASANVKGISLRRALVVFQFVIAQALIIGTLIVASQMNYFRNADMGFNKKAIINASFPNDSLSRTKVDLFSDALGKIHGVQRVSLSSYTPSATTGWYTDLRKETNHDNTRPDVIVSMKLADTGYFRLYNLPLVAGRVYFPSDTMREYVVNEAVVKSMGIRNPGDAIGKMINVAGRTFPVVGVVKDFHTNSLRDAIGAVVLTTEKRSYSMANIQIDLHEAKTVIAALQRMWNNYYPDYVFEYNFIDQSIADYYKQENQLATLYKVFAGIAIFISCLGIYGLISFMAVQRRKEIGIRKVLGALGRDIVFMLSREFALLIIIAFLIAAPIAWYFMHQWLEHYVYRIHISVWFFIATICCSLVIAGLTVGYTAIRAAIANPVKSLRTE